MHSFMRDLYPVYARFVPGSCMYYARQKHNLIPKDGIDMTESLNTTQLRDDVELIEITVSWLSLKGLTHQVRESSKGPTYICNVTAPPARHAKRYQIYASCRLK